MPVEYTVDQKAVHVIAAAMKAEEDGKALRRDLLREMRAVGKPLVPELQSAVRSVPAVTTAAPGLRDAVAAGIKVGVRMSGKSTGIKVTVGATPGVRGFRFAGRALNRAKGWRHPVFGRDKWVQQAGKQWFEPPLLARRDEVRTAVLTAVESMAQRIAARAKQGAK